MIDELINEIKTYNKKSNLEQIRRAYEFAREAHKGQKRISGEEFIEHPLETAKILAKLRLDDNSIIAALLHDVVEDTTISFYHFFKPPNF